MSVAILEIAGTPHYMAPEQACSEQGFVARAKELLLTTPYASS